MRPKGAATELDQRRRSAMALLQEGKTQVAAAKALGTSEASGSPTGLGKPPATLLVRYTRVKALDCSRILTSALPEYPCAKARVVIGNCGLAP